MLIISKKREIKITQDFIKRYRRLKDVRVKTTIDRRLRQAGIGNFGEYRFLGDGLFEMKIRLGAGHRVYFTFSETGEIILVLLAGDKKTQNSDIEKCKKIMKEL